MIPVAYRLRLRCSRLYRRPADGRSSIVRIYGALFADWTPYRKRPAEWTLWRRIVGSSGDVTVERPLSFRIAYGSNGDYSINPTAF